MRQTLASVVALSAALACLPPHRQAQAAPAGETLAQRLPERTVLYAEVDVGGAAESLMEYLRFIAPRHAEGLEFNVRELIKCLREVAAQRDFAPRVMDGLADLRLYAVMMAKDEPEVKTHTFRTPKWDHEKGERIEGEFEEHTYTTRKEFALSLVAETPSEDVAADFVEQFRALQERLADGAERGRFVWRGVEVDAGEMMSNPSGGSFLGRLDRYVVFSNTNPVELWGALVGGADPSLADSVVYGRLRQEGEGPAAVVHLNLAVLIEKFQESLLRNLEEAEAKHGPVDPDTGPGAGFDQGAFQVQMAQASLEAFLTFEKLLSLDKLRAAGASVGISAGERSAASVVTGTLHMAEPISPVLELILDSGRSLEAPEVGQRDGILFMARLGLKEIFAAVTEALPPEQLQAVAVAGGVLKAQVGHDISEILEVFAGDICLYVDFVRKEVDRRRWDPETEEVVTERVVEPAPAMLFLVGVEDAEAFSRMLSGIVSRVSATPGASQVLGKRTFLASDVYLLGPGASVEGAEPDGMTSFAAAVVGRHLAVGGWKDVTDLVRRAGSGAGTDDCVSGLLAERPGSNLFMFVPDSFNTRFRELMKAEGQDPFDEIKKDLARLGRLPVEDEELRERLRSSIERLVEGLLAVAEKGEAGSAGAHAHGVRRDGFYEIRVHSEVRK
ncbi:MAG: hypothetical protein ACYTKD_13135 [Planctomycetota bacterium]|jgi:hypothetical protein